LSQNGSTTKINIANYKDETPMLDDISNKNFMAFDTNEEISMAQFEDDTPMFDDISDNTCMALDTDEKIRMDRVDHGSPMFDDISDKNCTAYGNDDVVTDDWIIKQFRKAASLGAAHDAVGPAAQPQLHHDDAKWMLKEIANSSSVAAPVAKAMLLEARMAAKRANKYKKKNIAKKALAKSWFGPERGSMLGRYDKQ
jgi:hypothetical protein